MLAEIGPKTGSKGVPGYAKLIRTISNLNQTSVGSTSDPIEEVLRLSIRGTKSILVKY